MEGKERNQKGEGLYTAFYDHQGDKREIWAKTPEGL